MARYDIGAVIGIEGEKELRDAIRQVNQSLSTLRTEMLAVSSSFEKGERTSESLAVHLHAVLCDTEGTIFCGHMLPGSIVCATAEISILVASEGRIARSFDEQTQFSLFRYTT